MPSHFHFLRPYFFWAFIPLIMALLVSFKHSKSMREWLEVCDSHLLKHLMVSFTPKKRLLSLLLAAITGSLMILSASGPTWEKLPEVSYSKKKAYVIVLDLSNEMFAQDITPSRIERAKYKIQDLLNELKEGQVGLLVFTQEPFLVSPLTVDTKTLSLLLPELSPNIVPVDGHQINTALEMAGKLITQAGYQNGSIFLLTPNEATPVDMKTAQSLASKGIHVSVMGVGTTLGAPVYNNQSKQTISRLDKTSLNKLAQAGNGVFVEITNDNRDIRHLVKVTSKMTLSYKKDNQEASRWKDNGRYLILLILPLALLSFRRTWFVESH